MAEETTLPPPPPPRKRRRKRKPPVPAPAIKAEAIRFQATMRAFVIYLQNPGVSVRAVWETYRAGEDDDSPYLRELMTETALQQVAKKQGWIKRRNEHWAEVKSRVESHLMDSAVQQEINEIVNLEGVKTITLAHITGDDANGIARAKPRSLEGVIKAYIDLDKRVSEKRGIVASETAKASATTSPDGGVTLPGAGNVPAILDNDDGFTDDEVAAMAEALAKARALTQVPEEPPPAEPAPSEQELDDEQARLSGSSDPSGYSDSTTSTEAPDADPEAD